MDKIIRCITSDGAVMASAIDASDIVFKAQKIHGLSRSATAALGRLLCATSMMGAMLKQKDASINLRVSGDLSLIHISEPTRQAEISYAVFCLKKKKTIRNCKKI